ncbi:hypothetical protein HAX54_050596 [Datura stramonium]|uniref:Uncharacterized protein n=1 Tax=Datura stramonium TaxID=4076 RepID=A0ABS8WLM0_DATST|nr:hypothetical protein [Datura stramonium]
MQRESYRYDDYYPDYEEEANFADYHMEDFQACTPMSKPDTWQHNYGNQGWNHYNNDSTGYGGGEKGNQRNRCPSHKDSRYAKIEAILRKVLKKLKCKESGVNKMREELYSIGKMVESHSFSIKQLKQQIEQISIVSKYRLKDDRCIAVATRSGKTTFDQ